MRLGQWTLKKQVGAILLAVCLASFVSGYAVMRAMQEENLRVSYNQSVALVSASFRQAEDKLEAAEQIAYNIIVSDAVQTAASGYLDAMSAGSGQSVLNQYTDSIGYLIDQQIIESDLILCANYIDQRGSVKVMASRGYVRLGGEEARRVEAAGIGAQGATVLMAGQDEDTLYIVKELREKRNLSMRHVGVLVLAVDMGTIGRELTRQYDGTFFLERDDLLYVLPAADEALTRAYERAKAEEEDGRRYALVSGDEGDYFAVRVPGRRFSCTVLIGYQQMFSSHHHMFRRYVGLFVALSLAACLLALILTRRATGEFQRLNRHLCQISGGDEEVIPLLQVPSGGNRDTRELYEAFNSMASRVNTLVDDNYKKQLLLTRTQLSALQAQINPHFLYNTLNAIYWAARESGNGQVADMTEALSRLLREAVNIKELLVSVDRELEIVRHYIRIQKFRFGDRLDLSFDVSEDVSEMCIPKFTLQVLIENAIHHGADKMLGKCQVRVKLTREGDWCLCRVSNTGPAPEERLMERLRSGELKGEGSGIGLINVEKRMKALLGEDSALDVARDEEKQMTVVSLRFQAVTAAEMEKREGAGHGGDL